MQHLFQRRWAAAGLLSSAIGFGSSLARALPEPVLDVSGSGVCPSPQAVEQAITELTSEERRREMPASPRVVVVDRGGAYDVSVEWQGGRAVRSFDDEGRNCDRRVRFAAVFSVVALLPPDIGPDADALSRPDGAAPVDPSPVQALPSAPNGPASSSGDGASSKEPQHSARQDRHGEPRSNLRLELGATFDSALPGGSFAAASTTGAELRAAIGGAPLSALVRLGYAASGSFELPTVTGDLSRIVAALGARIALVDGPMQLSMDAEIALAIERYRGSSAYRPATESSVGLGTGLGFNGSLPLGPVAPFLGVRASVWPIHREIAVAPSGAVGHVPLLWFGAVAGVGLSL